MQTEPIKIGVRELRANLSRLLREARRGASFVVMARDEVLAEIGPPSQPSAKRRKLGALKGQIWIAPDFDELPPDIIDSMENG